MKYYVTYKIDARYTVEIEADNVENAIDESKFIFEYADIGETEVIDSKPIIVTDENDNYLYEN